jgi:hypothetical protein
MAHPLVTGTVETSKLTRELGLTEYERDSLRVKDNELLYNGDHWLNGRGYIGAPPDIHDPHAGEVWLRLRRSFASYNAIKEGADRMVGCVLGQVPDYGMTVRRSRPRVPKKVPDPNFVPDPANPNAAPPMIEDPEGATELEALTPDEQKRIEEAAAALEVFYSSQKPLRWLKKLFRSRLLQGRAYARLFVPTKFRRGGRVGFARDFNEAVQRIFISQPDIEDAVCLTDEESRDELAVTRYKRKEGRKEVFELVFTDDNDLTYIATIEQNAQSELVTRSPLALLPPSPLAEDLTGDEVLLANVPEENISDPLDLGGRLTIYEMSGEPLITEQVRSQNASLNLNLTMANHVTVESGFREMAVTNVELEKETVADSRAPGGRREVNKRLKRGASVIHNFMSVSLGTDEQTGIEQVAPTDVFAFDPVELTTFDVGQNMFRRNILSELHQLWALITGDAAPSGESRIQAMADFVIFALDFQEEVEDAGTWLVETVLYWAAILAGRAGYFSDLRANFKTRLYLGRLTPDEKRLLMTEVDKRLRSKESYQIIAGDIADPAEENARIDREEARSVEGQRARINLEADRRALNLDTGGGAAGGAGE